MIIGLVGYARSGKDTTADFFVDHMNKHAPDEVTEKYSFASPIKASVNELMGWDERHSDGDLKEVIDPFWGVSPRQAYQTFGTEWARNCIRQDFWLKKAELKLQQSHHMVIADVRFMNEAKWIKSNGGILVRVERDNRIDIGETSQHVSEREISSIREDYLIQNNREKTYVEECVTQILHMVETA